MKKIILLVLALLCFAATASAAVVISNRAVGYTAPSSVTGRFAFAIPRNTRVKILEHVTCRDMNAGLIKFKSVPVIVAKLDKKDQETILKTGPTDRIYLYEGTMVEILRNLPVGYRCRVYLNKEDSIVYDFDLNMIRELYGSAWYKIEVNGMVGYILASDILV